MMNWNSTMKYMQQNEWSVIKQWKRKTATREIAIMIGIMTQEKSEKKNVLKNLSMKYKCCEEKCRKFTQPIYHDNFIACWKWRWNQNWNVHQRLILCTSAIDIIHVYVHKLTTREREKPNSLTCLNISFANCGLCTWIVLRWFSGSIDFVNIVIENFISLKTCDEMNCSRNHHFHQFLLHIFAQQTNTHTNVWLHPPHLAREKTEPIETIWLVKKKALHHAG